MTFVPEGNEVRVGLSEERLRAGLADVYAALTVEPVEAGYEVAGGEVVVTESRTGRKVEEGKLFDALEGGLFEGKREYEVPVAVDQPELTTAEAARLKPTELLGSYRTDYALSSDKSPERVESLEISSDAVSGTEVEM